MAKAGIVIAGLCGGSGKTIISLGIIAAWKEQGFKVSCFKKGPDYIDAGWLAYAAELPCYNLDTFLCLPEIVKQSYHNNSKNSDISVIEGNRGLYDGIDTDGSTSTAELAKLLDLPILLILDCTKSTRTIAALLLGCMNFDPKINICGVVLNKVAGKRHENKIRANIEKFCHIPVLGSIPKLKHHKFPERHMGLVPSQENFHSTEAISQARGEIKANIDLKALYNIIVKRKQKKAEQADNKKLKSFNKKEISNQYSQFFNIIVKTNIVKIGIIKDLAFQFYYPDNIAALQKIGAQIVFISPIKEKKLPDVHGIYMGGGFPEAYAKQLAKNESFKESLKISSENNLPIYAECGGFMFLGQSIQLKDKIYPMSKILPIEFGLSTKPQGHGYTIVKVINNNPFYAKGEILKGHEFRYSSVLNIDFKDNEMAFKMERGKGICNKKDGFFKNNTFGTYTHIHALGTPSFALSLVKKAKEYMENY